MTGSQLLKELQSLTPEQLKLPCVHLHTEYPDPEGSMGHEVEQDIDSVYVEVERGKYGQPAKNGQKRIRLGY